jgi:hypothetical protein
VFVVHDILLPGTVTIRGIPTNNNWYMISRVLLYTLCFASIWVGCNRRAHTPEPPAHTHWLPSGSSHWDGWLELVPAIQTPQFEPREDHTVVYAKFPQGSLITLANINDRRSLRVPAGSVLDRVERFTIHGRDVILDVRGTTFAPAGEIFHAYRPYDASARVLFGIAWPRADEPPDVLANAMHSAMLDGMGVVGVSTARRAHAADRFMRLLRCAGCHHYQQPERLGTPDGWPRRITDASGLYSLLSTLSDTSLLETYRPRDPNLTNPFVTLTCADGTSCSTSNVRRATLQIRTALAQGNVHARAVCAARRALLPWLGADVRSAYANELTECAE